MPTAGDQDEDEIEYGKWIEHTAEEALAEARKAVPKAKQIWPHWNNGVPTKLRLYLTSPTFSTGNVYHRTRGSFDTVELQWRGSHLLTELQAKPHLLPGHHGGVYRIFVPDTEIDRCCGQDKTGTLYIGLAGTGRNWSNLRTRVQQILNQDHHATAYWRRDGNMPPKSIPLLMSPMTVTVMMSADAGPKLIDISAAAKHNSFGFTCHSLNALHPDLVIS